METIQAFKTSDGKIFASAEEASEHEFSSSWGERINEFLSSPFCPYVNQMQQTISSRVIIAWQKFLGDAPPPKKPHRSIRDLKLPVRAENCLEAEGVDSIEQLSTWSQKTLMKIPNMGSKSIRDVVDALKLIGIELPPTYAATNERTKL